MCQATVDKLGAKGGADDKDTARMAILATWPTAPFPSSDKDLYLWESGKLSSRSLQKLMENGEESGLASFNCCLKLDSEYGIFQPQLNVSSLSGILVEHSQWSRICCHPVCYSKIWKLRNTERQLPVFTGVKLGLLNWRRNIGWGCLRIRCWRAFMGFKRVEGRVDWRRRHNDDLHNLYSFPKIIRVIKSKRMHERGMGECDREEMHTRFWWRNVRERDRLET